MGQIGRKMADGRLLFQALDSGAEARADSGGEEKADSGTEEANSGSHYDHDDPLNVGAGITVGVAMTLLLAFIVCYKVTDEVIADLLYLIDHICPKPNGCCRTLYNSKGFSRF